MAYIDQRMSSNRITALIIVALIHIVLGYALITGLAYSAAQQLIKKVTTVDIKKDEPKKPPPPPPPKPKNLPPPPVAPPVRINVAVTPPQIQTVTTPPPPAPVIQLPPPPVAPPPPPRFTPKSATPKGNPGDWASTDDYPSSALREERAGTTRFRLTVSPQGKATDCQVTSSSGSPDLDETTCKVVPRRARFTPAIDGEGQPTTGYYNGSVRWVIPKE
jgi:protein TonB